MNERVVQSAHNVGLAHKVVAGRAVLELFDCHLLAIVRALVDCAELALADDRLQLDLAHRYLAQSLGRLSCTAALYS